MKNKSYLSQASLASVIFFLLFSFGLKSQIDVAATGGTPFSSYVTLKDAFDAINAGTHQGVITIDIYVSTTEISSCVLNSSGAGSASYTSVLVRPANDGVTIAGTTLSGRGLIELNGADNVTIDGDNPNTPGTNRNLTLSNTASSTTTYVSVVRTALSSMVTSANDNTVKNCIISGNATGRNISTATSTFGSENTTYGILVAANASTVAATSVPNAITSVTSNPTTGQTANNFSADNNEIMNCARGIACQGSVQTVYGGTNGLRVTNNLIGNSTAGATSQVYSMGITAQGFGTTSTSLISGNTIYIESYVATAIRGIDLGAVSTTNANMTIENNIIGRVHQSNSSGQGAYGITMTGSSPTNHTVRNNFITNINNNITTSSASTTSGVFGIRISGGNTYKIYNNSVNIYGAPLAGSGTSVSSGFIITSTSITNCDVRNNIFSNTKTGASATSPYASIWLPGSATSAMNLTLNNNAYYSGTVAGQSGIAQVSLTFSAANLYTAANFDPTITTPSTNLRAYTSTLSTAGTNDNASVASTSAAPFISNSNLHLDLAAPQLLSVEQKGDAAVPLTVDIDGDVRPSVTTTQPDIGADEVTLNNCTAASGGTISPSSVSACDGLTTTLTSTGATVDYGISYQWMVSSISGGPYSNVTGGSNANTTSYTTGALTAGTYYYILQTTCSFASLTGTSNEVTVTVTANPAVTVSPTTATYCQGGTAVTLTGSGATTYSWLPATGLSASTGAMVDASPTTATTYTVTGTDAVGCIATATTAIAVATGVSVATVTATPPSVCTGGSSTLDASVYPINTLYCTGPYTSGTGFGDYITNVTLGTINNTTGAQATPYNTYYSALNTNLTAGTSYTVTGTLNNGGTEYVAVWIDYDQDGTFSATEKLGEQALLSYSIPFTVPAGAYNGQTRMRVRNVYNTVGILPCNSYSWGEIEDYNVTISGGVNNPGFTFSWSPATFLTSTTTNPTTATGVTAGNTYTVTATSTAGCSATGTVTLSAGTALTSTAGMTPNDTVCAGTSPSLTASGSGGGAPYTYAWSGPNGFTSTSQNPVLTNIQTTDAGTYTLTITDNCSSTSTSQVTIAVDPQPAITVSPTTSVICNPGGTAVTLTASGTSVSYAWTPTTGITPTTGDTVSANPTSTTVYTVTGTGTNGCTSAATSTVVVSNVVTISSVTASPANICPNGTTTLTANASNAGAYCSSPHTTGTGSGDYISQVTLNTLSNTTTGSPNPYYTLYPASGSTTTTLVAGTTYTISLSAGTYTSNDLAAFIDFNQNGVLNDAGEKLGETDNLGASPTSTNFVFTVPLTALNGPTRLRVRETDHAGTNDMTPCTSYAWGETEDYEITITGGSTGMTYSWSPATFLSSTTTNPTTASAVTAPTSYTVTVTSADGCASTGTVSITMDPLSAVTLATTPTNTVCAGTTITITSTVTGGGAPLTYAWSSGPTTANITDAPTATTGYTLTVTDNCGTIMSANETVTVNPNPIVAVTPDTALFCNPGTAVSLTASGATSYAWSPATGLSATTGSTVDANPTATTTYTVTGTDANGCIGTNTALINSATGVVISAVAANPAVLCSGNNSTLTVSSASALPPAAYCQPSTSCTFPDIISNFTFAGINRTSVCDATTGGYSYWPAFNPTVVGGTTYTLSVTTSGDTEGAAVWIDYDQDGVFSATEMVMSGYLGTTPATYTIAVTIPLTALNGQTVVRARCQYGSNPSTLGPCANTTWGETEDYLITVSGAADVATYAWSPATYLNSTTNDTVVAAAMMTSETYSVIASNLAGCTDTGSVSITVNPTPVAPAASNAAVCSGFGTTLTAAGTATVGWYDASTGGNYLAGGVNYTTPNLTSNASYFVQDSSAAGCISTRTQVDVMVNPNPVVDLGTDSTRCGGSVTLDAQNAGANYVWNTTATSQTITVNTSGSYEVTVTDVNGCVDSDTVNVTINPIPVVALGADVDLCADSVQLDAQNPGNVYLWNTTQTSQMITVTASGSYDVIVTSPQGCNGYDTISVILRPAPVVNLGPDTVLCGGSIILDAQNTGASFVWSDASTASINFVTSTGLYWVDVTNPQNCTVRDSISVTINTTPSVNLGPNVSVCDGDTVVLDAGLTPGATYLWNDNSTNQTFTTDTTGTYFVTVSTGPNCDASDTVTVTVNSNPVVTLALAADSICENGNPVTLSGESPSGGTFTGTGVNGTLFDPSGVTGSAVITYDFTDGNGCFGTASDTINIINAPVVSLSLALDTACADDGIVTLSGESPAGGTFSGTSVSGNSFDPSAGAGTYVITYSYTDSVTGCSNSATDNFLVDICTGAAFDFMSTLNVYPNPNKGEFFIEFASGEGNPVAELFTLQGKLIFKKQLDATTRNIVGVKELSNGIYMLRISYEGRVKNLKITVTQ